MTQRREEHIMIPEADLDGVSVDTLAVRAGQHRTGELEHSDAIFPTSSFVYGSAAQAAARFGGEEPGNIYSRFTNPTVRAFEERIAAMEGGERAVATASGMAAILATCMAMLQSGDHVVCSRGVFGTTNVLFQKYLARFGVSTTFVGLTDMDGWRDAVTGNTRMLFIETPSNPLCEVADMSALAELAHAHGGGQLFLHTGTAAPAGVRSRHRDPLRYQVPGWTGTVCRRCGGWQCFVDGRGVRIPALSGAHHESV